MVLGAMTNVHIINKVNFSGPQDTLLLCARSNWPGRYPV